MMRSFHILALLLSAVIGAKSRYIVPGARWKDTNGDIVNAHAGCVVVENGTFWLFGEYKIQGHVEGAGVSVYSSEDLATWKSHGLALCMCILFLLSSDI
jgi:hypothetical protein